MRHPLHEIFVSDYSVTTYVLYAFLLGLWHRGCFCLVTVNGDKRQKFANHLVILAEVLLEEMFNMTKKNRIRNASGMDKLEARELLSGSSISNWCSMPHTQVLTSVTNDCQVVTAADGTLTGSADDFTTSSSQASSDCVESDTTDNVDNVYNTEVSEASESVSTETNVSESDNEAQVTINIGDIAINNFNQFSDFSGENDCAVDGSTTEPSSNIETSLGSSREFNGSSYNLIKNKGNKLTYKNTSLPGGQRTVDFNPTSGTFKTHSPITLDLNGSGAIETTGSSTAKNRMGGTSVGHTVAFDIDGDGVREKIEWLSGNGDGLLVDDRDGGASKNMNGNRLFGDANGHYSSGYEKLATLDVDGDGMLSGTELDGLKVWLDNGDARVQNGEMRSLAELGVDQISVQRHDVSNSNGEILMQSIARRNGQSILTEDVWFGQA